ncbi:MAG: hypothetical protein RL172_1672 [Bacteroidota bacterium]
MRGKVKAQSLTIQALLSVFQVLNCFYTRITKRLANYFQLLVAKTSIHLQAFLQPAVENLPGKSPHYKRYLPPGISS